MSKTQFKDIKHFFTVTPDLLEVKGFADGVEGTLQLSWQHPMIHTDEDDEQPAEGTNHIRIEVKTEWLPFDPENIPEAKSGWCLLLRDDQYKDFVDCFTNDGEIWKDYEGRWFELLFDSHTKQSYLKYSYKLVPLT
jgi:hypothetical protein